MAWSLKNELCEIAGTDNLSTALIKLNIISSGDDEGFVIREDKDWIRGGSETYIYRFWVQTPQKPEVAYIVKACTAFSFGQSLSQLLDEWIERRTLLTNHGVSTPKFIGRGAGLIIEEFIPYHLRDQFIKMPPINNSQIDVRLAQLASFSGVLHSLGFLAIEPFNDLRSRGDDVVIIDFGEDLGHPQGTPMYDNEKLYGIMIDKLREWGLSISEQTKHRLYDIYIASVNLSGANTISH